MATTQNHKDVHTEHCCRKHGCKYGDDESCSVASGIKKQSIPCGKTSICHEEDYDDYIEPKYEQYQY